MWEEQKSDALTSLDIFMNGICKYAVVNEIVFMR
jgi:hypothetical protein